MGWPWVHEMVERLEAAVNGEKARVMAAYADLTGKSVATLYRIAKQNGYRPDSGPRKPRADKGVPRSGLTREQLTYVAGLVEKTGRENKGGILPVEAAMEIAHDQDIIPRGQASVSTVQRLLRQHQMDKERMKDPTPHTPLRSLHPNHVHAVDTSVCIQYYLKRGGLAIMDERDFYKNKPDAFARVKQKLLRYVLTDHFSGLFVFRYFLAGGENAEQMWAFLKWAWRTKDDPRLPFHGVPKILLADGGSPVRTARALRNAIEALGVEIPKGRPYNPRRQGGAECAHNQIETWFEPKLRIQPASDVVDFNAWADDFLIWFHATRVHERHQMTRTACWLMPVAEGQVRLLPDDDVLDLVCTAPQECTVMNLRIRYQGAEFSLKHLPGIHQRAKVTAHVNPYLWKSERVITVAWQGVHYDVRAIERLDARLGGFEADAPVIGESYKAQPQTATQKAKQTIDALAGTSGKRGEVPFAGTVVFGNYADKVGNVIPLQRAGIPIDVSRSVAVKEVALFDLLMRVRGAVGTVPAGLNAALREALGESVEVGLADAVVAAIAADGDWRATAANHASEGAPAERQAL